MTRIKKIVHREPLSATVTKLKAEKKALLGIVKQQQEDFQLFLQLIDSCGPDLASKSSEKFKSKHTLRKKEEKGLKMKNGNSFLTILLRNMFKIAKNRTRSLLKEGYFEEKCTVNTVIIGPVTLNFKAETNGEITLTMQNLKTSNLTASKKTGEIVHFAATKIDEPMQGVIDIHDHVENTTSMTSNLDAVDLDIEP